MVNYLRAVLMLQQAVGEITMKKYFLSAGAVALSALMFVQGSPAFADSEKMGYDITQTRFCKNTDGIQEGMEAGFFQDFTKNSIDYIERLKNGPCKGSDKEVPADVARAVNQIIEKPDSLSGATKNLNNRWKPFEGAKKIEANQGKEFEDYLAGLPKELAEPIKDTQLCKSPGEEDYQRIFATADGLGKGDGKPVIEGDTPASHYISGHKMEMYKKVCNADKSIPDLYKTHADRVTYTTFLRNMHLSILIVSNTKEAELALAQLRKNIQEGKGTSGIPIPGTMISEKNFDEVYKNGATGGEWKVSLQGDKLNTSTGSIDALLTDISTKVLTGGSMSVYPGYSQRFDLIVNPEGATTENIGEFLDALDTSVSQHASESFMLYSGGKVDQGDAPVRLTVKRPDTITVKDWNEKVAKDAKEVPYRSYFLGGSFKELGSQPDASTYSIIYGEVPKFFMTKDGADQWLTTRGLGSLKDNVGAEDLAAKALGFKDRWSGYGLSLSDKISKASRDKGMTLVVDKIDDEPSSVGAALTNLAARGTMATVYAKALPAVGKFSLKQVATISGPTAMRMHDAAFTGQLALKAENRAALVSFTEASKKTGSELAQQRYPGNTKLDVLKRSSAKNAYVRSARQGWLSEYGARGAKSAIDKGSAALAKSISTKNLGFVAQSALVKTAGFTAGKSAVIQLAEAQGIKAGVKIASMRSFAAMIGTLGGPYGWAISAVIFAVDVVWNWKDYSKWAKEVTRWVGAKVGLDLYPEPSENDFEYARQATVMYGGFGLIDTGGEHSKYITSALNDNTWSEAVMMPMIEKNLANK